MSLVKAQGKRALDRILAEEFLDELTTIPLATLRERRLLVDHEEAWLSYLRRMLHGRIDILEATVAMRRDGRDESRGLDIAALVSSLATQMGPGKHPIGLDVVESPGAGRRAVERLIARAGLDEYSTMSDAQLDGRLDELRDVERDVSEVRHRVHEVHGQLTQELARRYRSGEAQPDSALKRHFVTDAPVLVEVERDGMVESQHRGHVVVVDESGAVVAHLGDPESVIYPRSAVKPLQATGMVQLGLDTDGSTLALAAASHSGEPFHIEGVCELLHRAGLTQSALQCPADLPYGTAARDAFLAAGSRPAPVVMNCSGKHAAMLWTCVINGWEPQDYLQPDHPLQRYLRDTITTLAKAPAAPTSTDGCGAPLYGLPLVGLARALQVMPSTPAGARVGAAMRAYPEFVGGTDRDVTHLMRGVPGLVAKDGAEAVQAMVVDVDGRRFGISLKIEDGAQRARSVVAAAVLEALGMVTAVTVEHRRQTVLGGGRPVGWIRPSAALDGLRVAAH